jgi:branched-chain amino acid transport system ATP-binding protein
MIELAPNPTGQPALETRNLNRRFGSIEVASNIDFRLERGARHALIGPNGAGKTTFVNLLTGQVKPSSGAIYLNGHEVTALSTDRRVRLGLARTFQINALLKGLTVLENVQLAVLERRSQGNILFFGRSKQVAAAEAAYALLQRLQLADVALHRVSELPYGRQRLVEVAIGLALEPDVLLLDEPAAGVTPADSDRMFELIESLPASIAVLIIEHDMKLVFRFAKRITVLVQGKVLVEGPPEEIPDDQRVRDVYLGNRTHA